MNRNKQRKTTKEKECKETSKNQHVYF